FGRESDIPELLMGDILALRLHIHFTYNHCYVKNSNWQPANAVGNSGALFQILKYDFFGECAADG
ncbi:hypothetical protein, partial [Aliiroseovarius zhejiangensis]|uniref:hypothetical protein n=1 Tax=Aliiroseovarius zhejiangensis TaxID=1632025 RepID=UPI001E63352F